MKIEVTSWDGDPIDLGGGMIHLKLSEDNLNTLASLVNRGPGLALQRKMSKGGPLLAISVESNQDHYADRPNHPVLRER